MKVGYFNWDGWGCLTAYCSEIDTLVGLDGVLIIVKLIIS